MERRKFLGKISTFFILILAYLSRPLLAKDKKMINAYLAEIQPLLDVWKVQLLTNMGTSAAFHLEMVEHYIHPASNIHKQMKGQLPIYRFENIHGQGIKIEVPIDKPAIFSIEI